MRGMGRIYKRGPIWWVCYYHRGKQYRESSRSDSEAKARKLLRKRLGEIEGGRFIGPDEGRLTFDELAQDFTNDYLINGRKSASIVTYYVKHLRYFFGLDLAIDITQDRVKAYQAERLQEGAAHATINREVACLSRMLSLAVNGGKLFRKPKFQMLEERNVRQGFVEHGDFMALLIHLPSHLRDLVEFLYLSGWRKGEATSLEWRDADLHGRTVRLRSENSKNKEARILPLNGRLWEIVQAKARERRLDCPFVFHHGGQKIGDFRKRWKRATRECGLEWLIVHDLRRCAARNLSRAGVPESVAMEITGHKTRSMYRRYRIVDERDLREATERVQAHLHKQPRRTVTRLKKPASV